jgi:phosphate transport system protein
MFETLKKMFGSEDTLVDSALQDTCTMLDKSQSLFMAVSDAFLSAVPIDFDVYEADKKINGLEITIRRKILQHLSIHPKQDIVSSLVLTSIIIDIERIGDYSKNIFELQESYPALPQGSQFTNRLAEVTESLKRMFELTNRAFASEDAEKGEEAMRLDREISAACSGVMQELAMSEEVGCRETVTLVLYARYLKRASAHLSNVVTAVINPFDQIGYFLGKDLY